MINDSKDDNYNDIINLPHHVSKTHPRMSLHDRAAQFSPFAALTGHEEEINESARLTEKKLELDEDEKIRINEKLQFIKNNIDKDITVTFTYFVPDVKKAGGEYRKITGKVKKINIYEHKIIMSEGRIINIEDIIDVDIMKKFIKVEI